MCTYDTETLTAEGSAKGGAGWFAITDATVYFDHPVHARAGHTLNIDFRAPAKGPGARVAVELTADTAERLAHAILASLESAPAALKVG
jgi:Family of unknown function (DUF6295)